MLSENEKLYKKLGFDKWDGYPGSRVTVIMGEDFETYPSGHPGQAYRTMLEFCTPGTVLYSPMVTTGGQDFITETIPRIKETKACVCGASMKTTNNDCAGEQYDEPLESVTDFCPVAMCGGYRKDGTYNVMAHSQYIDCVGAFYMDADTGRITGMGYTGPEDSIDFCGPGYVWIPTISGGKELFDGNSAALPVVLAQRVRIQDFFIAKTGKPLGHEAMYQFQKDCCTDLGTSGYDIKTGWGAPVLPDPESIDIDKYRGDSMIIKLQVGNPTMTVDGVEIAMDQPPISMVDTQRVLVPVRAPFEAAGFTVEWDNDTQTVTITK